MNIRNARRRAEGRIPKESACFFPKAVALFAFCLIFLVPRPQFLQPDVAFGAWSGVDESVVEKVAGEHGRHAREPFINTDQGDLLLFVFLLAGAVGGFAAGYYWRVLMENKSEKP